MEGPRHDNKRKVLVEIRARERTCGLTYVQLSRCTDINNLRITRSISLDRLTTHIQKSKSLQLRLNEEIRLQGIWKDTLMSMNLDESLVVFLMEQGCDKTNVDKVRDTKKKSESQFKETDILKRKANSEFDRGKKKKRM